MSGLTSEALAEFLQEKSSEEKPSHIHNLLKFVALRKDRSAIMAVGGRWDEELDGGDPANGDSALIKTAIRLTSGSHIVNSDCRVLCEKTVYLADFVHPFCEKCRFGSNDLLYTDVRRTLLNWI